MPQADFIAQASARTAAKASAASASAAAASKKKKDDNGAEKENQQSQPGRGMRTDEVTHSSRFTPERIAELEALSKQPDV